ncbi:MAG: dual specificity protein phosphatase family protein [Marinobacter sp.]|nr:dual specificity protein phosphatase family protein [Marinobacter sp.]
MIEVCHNLFVGNEADAVARLSREGWYIIHACKEPFHRQALRYKGRAAPKDHPEYLIAKRDNRLILNLVDANDPAYIPREIIDGAVEAIHANIIHNQVLVHCNQGLSRSPTIAFLYLLKYTTDLNTNSLPEALTGFKTLYPPYSPAGGMAGFLEKYWESYAADQH